jgi:lysozyme family protein
MIHEAKGEEVEGILSNIGTTHQRYVSVGNTMGIPWHVIAVIHTMESSLNFNTHLHNGDPLTQRTIHVPHGRPLKGDPPFTWEESATDALELKKLYEWEDWSLPGILYKLEEYNGWGYRLYHPHVLSPYLWSGSTHYTGGKYAADGTWSETATSRQTGAAVLLRRMAEKGMVELIDEESRPTAEGAADTEPLIRYSSTDKSRYAEELQKFLSTFPGVYVKVDGYPGAKTSEAFKKVTGYYLYGDPRA